MRACAFTLVFGPLVFVKSIFFTQYNPQEEINYFIDTNKIIKINKKFEECGFFNDVTVTIDVPKYY